MQSADKAMREERQREAADWYDAKVVPLALLWLAHARVKAAGALRPGGLEARLPFLARNRVLGYEGRAPSRRDSDAAFCHSFAALEADYRRGIPASVFSRALRKRDNVLLNTQCMEIFRRALRRGWRDFWEDRAMERGDHEALDSQDDLDSLRGSNFLSCLITNGLVTVEVTPTRVIRVSALTRVGRSFQSSVCFSSRGTVPEELSGEDLHALNAIAVHAFSLVREVVRSLRGACDTEDLVE